MIKNGACTCSFGRGIWFFTFRMNFDRDGQKPEFFENPGFGFDPGFKMKNPGFSG